MPDIIAELLRMQGGCGDGVAVVSRVDGPENSAVRCSSRKNLRRIEVLFSLCI